MSGFLEQCQFVLDKLTCIAINQDKCVFRSKTMRYVEEKECNMDIDTSDITLQTRHTFPF